MKIETIHQAITVTRLVTEEARGEGLTGAEAQVLLAIAAQPGMPSDVIERSLGHMNTAEASAFRRSVGVLVKMEMAEPRSRGGRRRPITLTRYGTATAQRISYRVGRRLETGRVAAA